MFDRVRSEGKYREILILGAMSALCFGLSVFRFIYTDTRVFLFLNWNLFLAAVPWILSSIAMAGPRRRKNLPVMILLLGAWLIFFPNAPYILTDLFHLRYRSMMPSWFDLVLVLSFAWTGLMFGFISLKHIEHILSRYLSRTWVFLAATLLLFAGSFGVYLGRYLRWNSWDLLSEPYGLLGSIGERFASPAEHPRTWGMTILLGILLNMIYWSVSTAILHKSRNIQNSVNDEPGARSRDKHAVTIPG
jgi:uncharacterized membrane protein